MTITSGSIPEALPGGSSSGARISINPDPDVIAATRRAPLLAVKKKAFQDGMCAHQAPGVTMAHNCHYTGRTEA